ncbi:hypothetical protein [Roseivirga pacifica]|uniref:hypothetical protein n=1 Tax=Roseivirga pacifica TaxID=1267423 RepID=UPI003BAD3A52
MNTEFQYENMIINLREDTPMHKMKKAIGLLKCAMAKLDDIYNTLQFGNDNKSHQNFGEK